MEELENCLYCGSEVICDKDMNEDHLVRCVRCYARGPSASSKDEAITAWNAVAKRGRPVGAAP
jgi:hypothetical protein